MIEKHVKILFRFYSDLLEKNMVETVWAKVVNEDRNFYQIDSIPFYIPDIASDDIIQAQFDKKENQLVFKESIEYSGNSLIRVFTKGNTNISSIRNIFKELNCISEQNGDNYFVIEIPKKVNYSNIKKELQKLEEEERIIYSEAVLSEEHKY